MVVGVSLRFPLPSAFMTETAPLPPRLLTKAIFLPSGDQAGVEKYAVGVSLRFPLPSAFMT